MDRAHSTWIREKMLLSFRSQQFVTTFRRRCVEEHARELTAIRPVRSRAAACLASTFTIRTQIKAPTSSVPVPLWHGDCCRSQVSSSQGQLKAGAACSQNAPLHMCQLGAQLFRSSIYSILEVGGLPASRVPHTPVCHP